MPIPTPLVRRILSLPRWVAIASVVGVSVVLSLAATRLLVPPERVSIAYERVMLIAVLVPSMVAGPVSAVLMHLLHALDRLRDDASRLARIDALTGTLNRRSFDEIAALELQRAVTGGQPLSLLILDVDDFKRVNDRHGHAAGDRVLEAVAARCVQAVRPGDSIGRWGGEEFVVLLPGAGPAEGAVVAERLRASVRAARVPVAGEDVAVTVSVGLASVRPDTQMLDRLLGRADAAMYRAKTEGKDRVVAD